MTLGQAILTVLGVCSVAYLAYWMGHSDGFDEGRRYAEQSQPWGGQRPANPKEQT